MIIEFLNKDYQAIIQKLVVVSIVWGGVLLAILIDLYFGIQKARKLGEMRSSEGYRRSIDKFVFYFASMFFALLFDSIIPISHFVEFPLSAIPFVSIIAAGALIATEYKSVREKAEDKLRRKTGESAVQILELFKNKDAVLETLLNNIKETTNENPTINP